MLLDLKSVSGRGIRKWSGIYFRGLYLLRHVPIAPGQWRAAWRWLLVPLVISIVGSALSALFPLYGIPVFAIPASAVGILFLAFILLEMRGRILQLEEGQEKGGFQPLQGAEKERICRQLKEQLSEMPSIRRLSLSNSEQRTKVLEWHRKTTALLQKAYGGYTGEVQEFEELRLESRVRGGSITARRPMLDEAEAILRTVIDVVLECM